MKKVSFYTIASLGLLWFLYHFFLFSNRSDNYRFDWEERVEDHGARSQFRFGDDDKIRGVHFFARTRTSEYNLESLVRNNVEQIVLVPYAYQEKFDTPDLHFGSRRKRLLSRDSSYLELYQRADDLGISTIIKPHIWMHTGKGKWRSDIMLEDPAEFEIWAGLYTAFIVHYAALSQRIKAPAFCIGTELATMTKNYPEFWKQLIRDVRSVYDGKLFYAANWYEEYEQITFWEDLDYVGIQAYFPLADTPMPTVDQLVIAWKPYLEKIKKLSKKVGKPVLFTEVGYKSTADAARSPWEWVEGAKALTKRISTETQANCYEAFFRSFWHKPWFSGAIIWQWRGNHDGAGGKQNINFTPQNKPAQNVMAKWFGPESN